MSGLSLEEKAQVDARIQRRLREIWKIKSAAKAAPAATQNAAAAAQEAGAKAKTPCRPIPGPTGRREPASTLAPDRGGRCKRK